MGIEAWSTTAADNDSAPPDGAPEGMAPSGVNDTMRQIMASVRAWFEDAQWINFGHVPTRIDNDTFTVPTDLTAIYHAGRRLKVTGSATGYCTIASSSFGGGATTVNVTMDSGNLPATLTSIYLSILSASNTALPHGLADYARLSQNQTFTGTNTFSAAATFSGSADLTYSASGTIINTNANPTYRWTETGVAANNGVWDALANSEQFLMRAVNDALSVATSWIAIDRTGTTIDTVNFPNGTLQYGGLEAGHRDGNTVQFGGDHTLLTANRGKIHQYTSTGHTLTCPVALGTNGAFIVYSQGTLTVSASGGGLFWFNGAAVTGPASRTVAAGGVVTIVSNSGDVWISGTGIS